MRPLTEQDVLRSRTMHGSNQIIKVGKNSFLKQYLSSFEDPIIRILLVVLAINAIVLIKHFNWYEFAGIAAAILIATLVSTLSEYSSESAFIKLQEEASKIKCRVERANGVFELPVEEVVVGDLILLQSGERIPADGQIIWGEIKVDQSALNGEFKDVRKIPSTHILQPKVKKDDIDFLNPHSLFKGSTVSEGEGTMLVEKVGDKTIYGNLAKEIQGDSEESPLKSRLRELAQSLSNFGYIAATAVAVADLFRAIVIANNFNGAQITQYFSNYSVLFGDLIHAITLAITLIVVAVPEGLPMMIAVVLSSNIKRMLKDNVLVRKLVGVETSGNINILFTDKTGTLTRGRLQVTSVLSGDGIKHDNANAVQKNSALWNLIQLSSFYNTASVIGANNNIIGGNATDRALLEYVAPYINNNSDLKHGINKKSSIQFSSMLKYSVTELEGAKSLTLIKGAPEKILPFCTKYYDSTGNAAPFTSKRELNAKMSEATNKSTRLIAIAVSDKPFVKDQSFSNLTLVALICIGDEIRPDAKSAVRQIQRASIQIVMITGDNRETAIAIAKDVGILDKSGNSLVMTSEDLHKLTDDELKNKLPNLRVVARALPSDKSRLVRISQSLNMVVGMTGDGVNDAPALKKADIGFAMGSGSEVAKEASEIVIINDNLNSIAKAILYGRTIFKSIRKFIIFQLTINICAVGVSLVGQFIGIDTPITVVQMLWVNLIIDTLAGIAFAGEAPLPEYMREPPKKRNEPIINKYMFNQIAFTGIYTIILCIVFLKSHIFTNMFGNQEILMTAFFGLFIFTGIFNSFNARTARMRLSSNLYKNKSFLVVMSSVAIIQLFVIYFGGEVFRTTGLSLFELQLVIALAFTVIPADLFRKFVLSHSESRRHDRGIV